MTFITLTLLTIAILAIFAALACRCRHLAMRSPLEGPPPASWVERMEERG